MTTTPNDTISFEFTHMPNRQIFTTTVEGGEYFDLYKEELIAAINASGMTLDAGIYNVQVELSNGNVINVTCTKTKDWS